MSTNFYLYPTEALRRDRPRDEIVEVHIAKRHAFGLHGTAYTVQAVNVGGDDDERVGAEYCVANFPRIESWRDWSRLLLSESKVWTVRDEYGGEVGIADFVGNVMFQGARGLAHERHMGWLKSGNYTDTGDHYLDDDGFSICSSEFS